MSAKFDEWYAIYPKKQAKAAAKKKWDAMKLNDIADTIIGHTVTRAKEDEQWLKGFIPMPSTFLNQKRWEDTYDTIKPRYEPSTTIVDESIAGEGLLGSARALNVAIKDDAGVPFTTEQLSKLIWCKDWMKRGIPDEKNIHLIQLPEAFHKYLEGVAVPF